MPRAGFYTVQNTPIRLGRDGHWYADDQRITNRRIAALFSRHVCRGVDGAYVLRIADEQALITVDDTPYVITGAETDSEGVVWVDLNDGTRECLDPESLAVGADEVLYCRVKRGSEPARFLRSAYYQVAQHIARADGGFVFEGPQGRYPIGRR